MVKIYKTELDRYNVEVLDKWNIIENKKKNVVPGPKILRNETKMHSFYEKSISFSSHTNELSCIQHNF